MAWRRGYTHNGRGKGAMMMEHETAWTEHPGHRHAKQIGGVTINITPTGWPFRPWRADVDGAGQRTGRMSRSLLGAKCAGTRAARALDAAIEKAAELPFAEK